MQDLMRGSGLQMLFFFEKMAPYIWIVEFAGGQKW